MLCNNCGTENKNGNKFCIECGEELKFVEQTAGTICLECGAENAKTNKYCISCGSKMPLQEGYSSPQTKSVNKNFSQRTVNNKKNNGDKNKINQSKRLTLKPIYVVITLLAIVLSYLLISRNTSNDNIETKEVLEQKSNNPVVEAKVFEIASKFVCSCGTCGEESLETCKCPRAVEERSLIRDYIQKNTNTSDIVLSVANYYGFLKAEFAKEFPKVAKTKIFTAISAELKNDVVNKNIFTNKTLATSADRLTIISAFNCPCGKCGVDELKDCECAHPKGAKEVKGFIDKTIAESKYSADQIIDLVNKKYGGKKI